MKFIAILIVSLSLLPSVALAFKVDTHAWIGQQVFNDLEADGALTFDLEGQQVIVKPPADVVDAILSNRKAFIIGNMGPDAAPDVVIGQSVIHPGLTNEQGKVIGWQTNNFMEHLLNKSTSHEPGKAYSYGFLGHASADVFAHTYVNQYAGDVFAFDEEVLVEKRHIALEGFISRFTPKLVDKNGNNLGSYVDNFEMPRELAEFIRDTLIYDPLVVNEYGKSEYAVHLYTISKARDQIDKLQASSVWDDMDAFITKAIAAYFNINLSKGDAEKVNGWIQEVIDEVNSGAKEVNEFTEDIYYELRSYDDEIFDSLAEARDDLAEKERKWLDRHQELRSKALKLPEKLFDCGWWDVPCQITRKVVKEANEGLRSSIDALEDEVFDAKEGLVDAVVKLRDEYNKTNDSIQVIFNQSNDFLLAMTSEINPIRAILKQWRDDIDLAMLEYVIATNKAIANSTATDLDSIDPMREWFDCYFASLIGLPQSISGCEFKDSLGQLTSSIDNVLLIADELGIKDLPGYADLLELRENLIASITDRLKERVGEEIYDIIGEERLEVLDVLEESLIEDDYLTAIFSQKDESRKKIIKIEDVVARVKSEMHLSTNQSVEYFDPERYSVIRNSIVMAKLSLLSSDGLQALAASAGAKDFDFYSIRANNIVASAFNNIDGNHHWLPQPPPLARDGHSFAVPTISYSTDQSAVGGSKGYGFLFWQGDMREKMFEKLFQGSLTPGITDASHHGHHSLISSAYPYQTCAANPFPDKLSDRTCLFVKILPAILMTIY